MNQYHGTITAIRHTRTGHMILQLDRQKDVVVKSIQQLTDKDGNVLPPPSIRVYDNIKYTETPAPTAVQFQQKGQKRPEPVKLKYIGIDIIAIQHGDKTVNHLQRIRREKGKSRVLPNRPALFTASEVFAAVNAIAAR